MQICSLLRGGIGERGGVRVGHRIIEINAHSMVAVPHEKIVHVLATSVGEVSGFFSVGRAGNDVGTNSVYRMYLMKKMFCAV